MMRTFILITMLMLGSVPAHADEIEPATTINNASNSGGTKQQDPQSATRAWLEFQRSGQAASDQPQPLSGHAMDRIHERYINSFSDPIPEFYDHAMPIIK